MKSSKFKHEIYGNLVNTEYDSQISDKNKHYNLNIDTTVKGFNNKESFKALRNEIDNLIKLDEDKDIIVNDNVNNTKRLKQFNINSNIKHKLNKNFEDF